ncbi:hypothetical protein [Vibrio cincinnatiensis]|uniref:hypothetical protein n=1 Tax=Vibrio cincinnatiensis TaxID=675 RepID=UPI001302733D|nr:hypothetical protein [Vibrio cincinnatiensis]
MIVEVSNAPEYASLPPSQIVPTLPDKGAPMKSLTFKAKMEELVLSRPTVATETA